LARAATTVVHKLALTENRAMGQSCEAMRYEDVLVISCAESSSAMNLNDSTPAHGRHARYPNDEQWTSEFALNPSVTWSMHEPMCGTPELGSHSSDLHLNGLGKATVRREDLLVDDSRLFCDDSVLPSGLPTAVKAWTVPQHEVKMRSLKVVGWFTVIALRFQLKTSKRRSYELDQGVAEDSIKEMDLDLPRVCLLGPAVSAHSGRIRALLLRHLAEDPELGYCQGMHLVAAVFSEASGSQDEAYMRFHRFMGRARGLWAPGFPLLRVGAAQLEVVAKTRPWYGHLLENSVEASMFLPQALMTMFTMWLPLETVVDCLALMEDMGLKAMVAITLAILDNAADRLLAQQDLEGILGVLQALHECPPSAEAIGTAASSLLPDVSKALPRPPPTHPEAASRKRHCSYTEARSPKRHRSCIEEPHVGSVTERAMESAMEPL